MTSVSGIFPFPSVLVPSLPRWQLSVLTKALKVFLCLSGKALLPEIPDVCAC